MYDDNFNLLSIKGGSVRAYSSCFMHAIKARMKLPFLQNIFKFFTFLSKFSNISPLFWSFFTLFLKSRIYPLLSRICRGCTSSTWTNFFCNFETTPVNKVFVTFSRQNHTPLQLLPWIVIRLCRPIFWHNNLVSQVRNLIRPWNFWNYVSLTNEVIDEIISIFVDIF